MSDRYCTWEGCDALAKHPQIARDGERWANLCDEHAQKMDNAIKSTKPGAAVAAWIRAQGGRRKAMGRM